MGFLKKSNAPSELPDLAMENSGSNELSSIPVPSQTSPTPIPVQPTVAQTTPEPIQPAPATQPVPRKVVVAHIPKKEPVAGEDYLEFSNDSSSHEDIKKSIDKNLSKIDDTEKSSKLNFFDEVLEDINVELKDIGKLGDWYENKFAKEDVVSNMRIYWEGNKADIIIESFGAEYKRQINDKVKILRGLEEDWREIYFKLVKKEEEMKKEERELKETLSEFVDLCKRRKNNEKEKVEDKKT